jgi:hypothetical protein
MTAGGGIANKEKIIYACFGGDLYHDKKTKIRQAKGGAGRIGKHEAERAGARRFTANSYSP